MEASARLVASEEKWWEVVGFRFYAEGGVNNTHSFALMSVPAENKP